MKQRLKEFVDWMELIHLGGAPNGSTFEQSVPPHVLAWAERALELALSSQCPVVLYTRSVSAHALVAALVFRRAGIQLEDVYSRNLNDEDFDRLAATMTGMNSTAFEIVESWPSASIAKRMTHGRYVFLC